MKVNGFMYSINSMKFQSNSNITFGSKNCPIPNKILHTKKGDIFVREAIKEDIPAVAKFVNDTSIEAHSYLDEMDDFEKVYYRNKWETQLKDEYRDILSQADGNSTILIAENKDKKIIGTFIMEQFKARDYTDQHTGHIPACYIDADYKNAKLGGKLLDLLINSVKGFYTDIFLEANNKAIGFYERFGFKTWELENEDVKCLHKKTLMLNEDSDKITLLAKNLDPKNSWYKRINKVFTGNIHLMK